MVPVSPRGRAGAPAGAAPQEAPRCVRGPWRGRLLAAAPLSLSVLVHLALAGASARAGRGALTPDGVCYLLQARAWAEGRWGDALSPYWSPLLSLGMAPLLAAGIAPLTAAKAVCALCGALALASLDGLLRACGVASAGLRLAALLAATVPVTALLAARAVAPDLLMGALLLAYLKALLSPRLLASRWQPFVAGGLAGLAFLAKAYALPFAVVHLPVAVWLRARAAQSDGRAWRRVAFRALAGLALAAGPWLLAVGLARGCGSFLTLARANHAYVGPPDRPRGYPLAQLYDLAPRRVSVWETPEVMRFEDWSPLASRQHLAHQARVVSRNAALAASLLAPPGPWAVLGWAALLLSVGDAWRRGERTRTPVLVAGLAVYVAGLLPAYAEPRYLLPVLVPLSLCLLAASIQGLRSGPVRAAAALLLATAWAAPFAAPWARQLTRVPQPAWQEVSGALDQARAGARLAASADQWANGLRAAWAAGLTFPGSPRGATPQAVAAELAEHRVEFFLAGPAAVLPSGPGWRLMGEFLVEDGRARLLRREGAP